MINSMWCWGGDAYHGEKFNELNWFSDDELMQQLGQLFTETSHPVSEIPSKDMKQDSLVINLSLLQALKGISDQSIFELLLELENLYLSPIMRQSPAELHLLTGGAVNFHYNPRMRWKLWRRKAYPLG